MERTSPIEDESTVTRRGKTLPRWASVSLALMSFGLVATGAAYKFGPDLLRQARGIETEAPVYNPNLIFNQPPGSITIPLEETPPNPTVEASREVGDKNIAEYLLDDLVRQFIKRRLENASSDPSYAERVNPRFLNSNRIYTLFLGTDETEERPNEQNGNGWGHSDVILMISTDLKTLESFAIPLQRDLFAPELIGLIPSGAGGARLANVTLASFFNPEINSQQLARRIAESATGWPVDVVSQATLDFVQGTNSGIGILDALAPNGLTIEVAENIKDNRFPAGNYGYRSIEFGSGFETMDGRRTTDYIRSRKTSGDFDRMEKQKQVAKALFQSIRGSLFLDVLKGNTDTLDSIIDVLDNHTQQRNLLSDVNIVGIFKTTSDHIKTLRSTLKGISVLGVLTVNSLDLKPAFNELQLIRGSDIEGVSYRERFYTPYMLKLKGSSTTSDATDLGNHLTYWNWLREKVAALDD